MICSPSFPHKARTNTPALHSAILAVSTFHPPFCTWSLSGRRLQESFRRGAQTPALLLIFGLSRTASRRTTRAGWAPRSSEAPALPTRTKRLRVGPVTGWAHRGLPQLLARPQGRARCLAIEKLSRGFAVEISFFNQMEGKKKRRKKTNQCRRFPKK